MNHNLRVSVGGDPQGGWLVDLHDGETHVVLRPNAPDKFEAAHQAIETHRRAVESQADRVVAEGNGVAAGVSAPSTLRDDGPTLTEFVAAGYDALGYPPFGYQAKPLSDAEKLMLEGAQAARANLQSANQSTAGQQDSGNAGGTGAAQELQQQPVTPPPAA